MSLFIGGCCRNVRISDQWEESWSCLGGPYGCGLGRHLALYLSSEVYHLYSGPGVVFPHLVDGPIHCFCCDAGQGCHFLVHFVFYLLGENVLQSNELCIHSRFDFVIQ